MTSNQDTNLKGFRMNVTNEESLEEPNTKNIKKRSLSNTETVDLPIEKRKKGEDFEYEETVLRDRLLDDTLELTQTSENQTMEDSNGETAFCQFRKIIRIKGKLPNLALPEGWLALNHRSGGIIYLHRSSRVCTWSRPYYIGKGSVRKHDVPIAAIPCLHQEKALETESKLPCFQSKEQQASYSSGSLLNFINTAGTSPLEGNSSVASDDGVDNGADDVKGLVGLDGKIDNSVGDGGVSCRVGGNPDDVSGLLCGGDSKGDDGGTITKCNDDKIDDNTPIHGSGSHKKDNIGIQKCIPEIFHPKDGLDVINDTLSAHCPERTQNTCTKPSNSVVLISSSELETSTAMAEPKKGLPLTNEFCGIYNLTSKPGKATNDKVNNVSVDKSRTTEISDVDKIDINDYVTLKSSKSKGDSDFSVKNAVQNTKPICESRTSSKSGIELVDSEELTVYLEKLFDFDELTQDQEQNVAMTSMDQSSEQEESVLPPLLECLPYCVKGINAKQNKEWVLNPGGKTPIAILHEYSQAVLKEKPVYVCSECDNVSSPFKAEVQINGITHGTGVGSSKKQAKQAAAEATLHVFLPNVFKKICDYQISPEQLKHFDNLTIDHPSVYDVSIKSGLPSPSQLLQMCLKRNQGVCSQEIRFKIIPSENQNHSYKISCGKHTAEGFCKNKKTGKQLASQALLKKLHPHLSTWGSLLRIYCDRPSSIVKTYKPTDDGDILTSKQEGLAEYTSRGERVLARLKEEMKKLAEDEKHGRQSRPQTKDQTKDNPICTVDV